MVAGIIVGSNATAVEHGSDGGLFKADELDQMQSLLTEINAESGLD